MTISGYAQIYLIFVDFHLFSFIFIDLDGYGWLWIDLDGHGYGYLAIWISGYYEDIWIYGCMDVGIYGCTKTMVGSSWGGQGPPHPHIHEGPSNSPSMSWIHPPIPLIPCLIRAKIQ